MFKDIFRKVFGASVFVTAALCFAYFLSQLATQLMYNATAGGLDPHYTHCNWLKTKCTVRMAENIGHFGGQFQSVYHVLETAYPWTDIEFIVNGNGGSTNSLFNLVEAIRDSSGTVITVSSSRSYSAHGYLLLAGDKMRIEDGTLVLLHRSSLYGSIERACAARKGQVDRTQDAEAKCIQFLRDKQRANEVYYEKYLKPYLTDEEYQQFLDGFEVNLTGKELKMRIPKEKLS